VFQEGLLDDNDDFFDLRAGLADCCKDVLFVVGTERVLRAMFTVLQSLTSASTWDETDAALFVITAIGRNILPTENEVMPLIMQACLQLQPHTHHVALRHTAVRLMGEVAEWIERHDQQVSLYADFVV
jgi:transportin-3